MQNDFEKKPARNAEEIRAAVSGIALDAKNEARRTVLKVSATARDADKKVEKAGNEMKASLQQMKQNIQEFPRKAQKKNRK